MYNYTLHRRRKHFCQYRLQVFSTAEILESHLNGRFKINAIKMPNKGEHVKFKNYERKRKSPFVIYADFEGILVSEDSGNQNPDECYTNKYKKHVAST